MLNLQPDIWLGIQKSNVCSNTQNITLLHVIDDVLALGTAALGPQAACVGVWYSGILISSQA